MSGPNKPETGSRPASTFDGIAGRFTGPVMARMNPDMELAAVSTLNPSADDRVLAIGFGPGVGVEVLAKALSTGEIIGIDPSRAMVALARRRNRDAIREGRVVLHKAGAEAIPSPNGVFDGVVAVNSIQLWEPLPSAVGEVARVIRDRGKFVAMTHIWAIEKWSSLEEWSETIRSLLGERRFSEIVLKTQRFRSGDGLIISATANNT